MREGNKSAMQSLLGIGKDYTTKNREANDFYATEPKAAELLLQIEDISQDVWFN